jgi:sodium pump decarboxylase gamma subunit
MMLAMQYDFLEGVLRSIFCIAIVFLILGILMFIVWLFKFIKVKPEEKEDPEPEMLPVPAKKFGLEDIKDDDMMAAALVAAIDARETTQQDVVVKSIKEIK